MDTLYQLHPISIIGVAFLGASAFLFLLLFFSNELSYGNLKMKGTLLRSKKWPTMLKVAVGFLAVGALLFALGFQFPRPSNTGPGVRESTWHGTWDIEFMGETAPGDIDNAVFDHIQAEGGLLQAKIYDAEGGERGSFTRLKPSANPDDFRFVKGAFQVRGGKPLVVEIALHGNKETFSGFAYASKSAKRITCWGKKR